jgi:hypothetical protein
MKTIADQLTNARHHLDAMEAQRAAVAPIIAREPDPIVNGRNHAQGFRWSGLDSFIEKLAITHGLTIETKVGRRWFTIYVEFKVTGRLSVVRRFSAELSRAIEDYNRR